MLENKVPITAQMKARNRQEPKKFLNKDPRPGDRVEIYHSPGKYKGLEGTATLIRPFKNPFNDMRRDGNGVRWYVVRWEVIWRELDEAKFIIEILHPVWMRVNVH